jgi:hypothetical protein
MSKISSYPKDTVITSDDILIGSDGDNAYITKNFSVGKFLEYIEENGTFTQDTFIYQQATASSVWIISHGLKNFPSVTVIDSSGNKVFGDISYTDNNTLTLTFSAAFTGTAYLN